MNHSWAGLLAGAGLALSSSACCVTPPPPDKFFDRRESPLETLKGFVYAVDVRMWDHAYESLTRSSRERIGSRFRFEIAIKHLNDPVLRVPIFDLISDSVSHRGHCYVNGEEDGAKGSIRVMPRVRDRKGTTNFRDLDLLFVKEEGEWRLDLIGSVEAMERGVATPPEITRSSASPSGT